MRRLGYSEYLSSPSTLQSGVNSILIIEVHIRLSTLRALNGLARPVYLIEQSVLLLPTTPIGVAPLFDLELFLGSGRAHTDCSRVVAAGSLDLITCVMVIVRHVRLHHDGVHLVVLAAHDDDMLLPVIAASHLLLLLVALGRVETRLIQHVIVERG